MSIGDVSGVPQGVGAEAIIDAVVTNTPVFLQRSKTQSTLDGSIVLSNVKLTNVPTVSLRATHSRSYHRLIVTSL